MRSRYEVDDKNALCSPRAQEMYQTALSTLSVLTFSVGFCTSLPVYTPDFQA